MKLSISGVLPDGSVPKAADPFAQLLSAPMGVDLTVEIAVTKANGAVLDITGYTLTLTVRNASRAGKIFAELTAVITDAPNGVAHFTLDNALLNTLLGTYHYDVFADNSGAKDEIVPDSTFEVFAAPGA